MIFTLFLGQCNLWNFCKSLLYFCLNFRNSKNNKKKKKVLTLQKKTKKLECSCLFKHLSKIKTMMMGSCCVCWSLRWHQVLLSSVCMSLSSAAAALIDSVMVYCRSSNQGSKFTHTSFYSRCIKINTLTWSLLPSEGCFSSSSSLSCHALEPEPSLS